MYLFTYISFIANYNTNIYFILLLFLMQELLYVYLLFKFIFLGKSTFCSILSNIIKNDKFRKTFTILF